MKKNLKFIIFSITLVVVVIVIDTALAILLDSRPLLSIKYESKLGGVKYEETGIFVKHYECKYAPNKTVFNWEKYTCPLSELDSAFNIKNIKKVNVTDECAQVLTKFYEDTKYNYYLSCPENINVIYENGNTELLEDALKNANVAIEDLDKFDINYYKEEK